jgi:hypothetical protein
MTLSAEKRTMIFIEIRRDEYDAGRLRFLTKISGFNEEDSYLSDLPHYLDYITYTAFYDVHFHSRDTQQIKKSIEKNGGHVIKITSLGKEPMLSKENKNMLILCFVMGAVAFFSTLGGVNLFLPGKLMEALFASGITAAFTFFTELYIVLKIRQRSE